MFDLSALDISSFWFTGPWLVGEKEQSKKEEQIIQNAINVTTC